MTKPILNNSLLNKPVCKSSFTKTEANTKYNCQITRIPIKPNNELRITLPIRASIKMLYLKFWFKHVTILLRFVNTQPTFSSQKRHKKWVICTFSAPL